MRPLRCVCRSSASGTFRFDGLSVDVPPLCLTGFAVRRPGRFPCVLSEPFRCMPVSWSGFVPYCPSERQCSACRAVLCGSPDAACFAGAENCGHREETPPFYSFAGLLVAGLLFRLFRGRRLLPGEGRGVVALSVEPGRAGVE